VYASDVFNKLKELSGFIWRINPDKTLDFMDRSTNAAPWTLNTTDVLAESENRSGGNALYRNFQYIWGGTGHNGFTNFQFHRRRRLTGLR